MTSKRLFIISLLVFGIVLNNFNFTVRSDNPPGIFLIKDAQGWIDAGFNDSVERPVYNQLGLTEFNMPIALKKEDVPNLQNKDVNHTIHNGNQNFTDRLRSIDFAILESDTYYVVLYHMKVFASNQSFHIDFVPKIKGEELSQFAWWNSSWLYSRKITIDHTKVAGDLVNFPVLIVNSSVDFSNHARTDGYDFRLVNATNESEYYFEIEDYNYVTPGASTLAAWVNVTSLSSTVDTILYLYYGNASVNTDPSSTSTWDSHYVSVWHCNDADSRLTDSTIYHKNTTDQEGNPTYLQTGKIGYGVTIANPQGWDIPNDYGIFAGEHNYSLECWYTTTDTTNNQRLFNLYGEARALLMLSGNEANDPISFYTYVAAWDTLSSNNYPTGAWTYTAVTRHTVNGKKLYLNNTLASSNAWTGSNAARAEENNIGCNGFSNDDGFTGSLDELRISDIVRSPNWINTTYNTTSSPSTFMTFGDEIESPFSIIDPPADFLTSTLNISAINISWTIGANATHTHIQQKTGSYPTNRTDGTTVYNDTGTNYTNTGLTNYIRHYYRAWSFNSTSGAWSVFVSNYNNTGPANPTSSTAAMVGDDLNISWTIGANATHTHIQQKTGSYPTSETDGTNIYNDTGLFYVDASVLQTYYYTLFSWDNITKLYSSGVQVEWGSLLVNCFDEETKDSITFDILITNQDASETYESLSNTNPLTINVDDIPFGNNAQIQVSATDYKERIQYVDLFENTFYNISFYLPPVETGEGDEDCSLVTYTDSVSITNPAIDAVISLTHTVEILISVEIYNQSLYGTYGGWIFVAADKYTTYSTNITISNTILDVNTTMARVSYYYEYCIGGEISTPVYYIRIVETYETSSGIFERPVEDAKVVFQRYINTTDNYENISILLTDANGYINLYLVPSHHYQIIITKDGYDIKRSKYTPTPPNIYGQTTEKTFKIERTETEDEPIPEIYMDALILAPYNTTTVWIYYLNLNNNSYVNFTIYDYINGSSLLTYYNISTNPNNISIYFNFSSYSLVGDILQVTATAFRTDGGTYTLINYFNVEQSRRMGGATSAPIAAILSIGICLFGLTIAHPKKVFGVVGIIVMVIAIAITAFAEQIWYIHLIQAIELILLIVIILTFKEEGIHAV